MRLHKSWRQQVFGRQKEPDGTADVVITRLGPGTDENAVGSR